MKIENIYNKLKKINDEKNFVAIDLLLREIKQAILEESCLKTTSRTKINAIKRVLNNDYGIYAGWKKYNDSKVICNGFELYMIKNTDIPAKEVVEVIPKNANKDDYIVGNYLNIEYVFPQEYTEKIKINRKEILTAVKLKERMIKLFTEKNNVVYADSKYLKDAIDILGENVEVYYTGQKAPIVFENENGEKGIVLPIRPPKEE
jgi:hypothetical protein